MNWALVASKREKRRSEVWEKGRFRREWAVCIEKGKMGNEFGVNGGVGVPYVWKKG